MIEYGGTPSIKTKLRAIVNVKMAVVTGVAVCVLLSGMCSPVFGQELKIRGSNDGVGVNKEIVSAFARSRPDGGGKITVLSRLLTEGRISERCTAV